MRHASRLLFATLIVSALVAGQSLYPATALAEENLEDLQQKVEQTAAQYDAAKQHLDEVNKSIADNKERIDALEKQLPEMKDKAAISLRTLYKMNQSSNDLLDLILSSEDFDTVISIMQYLNIIERKNTSALQDLLVAQDELNQTKAQLEAEQKEAEKTTENAKKLMDDAVSARESAKRAAEEKAKAEAAEAAAALANVQQSAGQSFTTESGNTATVETPKPSNPSTPAPSQPSDNVNWSERDKFINEWTRRIDNYLAGSPMAGHGKTFATAAWDYGVDPRWSPAIATIESGKGRYCFKPHNAWGWGNVSWPDWDSAITSHVRGLSQGYGYTLTLAAARKYCPPNANFWYSSVLSQMNSI